MTIKNVCVYCGSSGKVDDIYKKTAHDLGTSFVQHDIGLVYGGGDVGLMGITARAVMENGGRATGIIPKDLMELEVPTIGLTELHVVDNMHERKIKMAKHADAFVTLPGGLGSLDETFEIMTWKQLGFHKKPIIIYNVDGYWDPMIELIENIITKGFAQESNRELFSVATNLEEVYEGLNKEMKFKADPASKWE